tara:strand:- start:657 stop:773 length:117 start_codon:yes stop_codon:yes gene_type:complete
VRDGTGPVEISFLMGGKVLCGLGIIPWDIELGQTGGGQ